MRHEWSRKDALWPMHALGKYRTVELPQLRNLDATWLIIMRPVERAAIVGQLSVCTDA